jgi:AcrR family transcriptional regulator
MSDQQKKSKKHYIIEAAAELFTEKGFKAASIRELAQRVGLEPSSIYSHIHSKEELLITICTNCASRFTEGMQLILNAPESSLEKVEMLIGLHVETAFEDPAAVAVFSEEWRHLPEPYLTIFKDAKKQYEQNFRLIIKQGMDEGTLRELDTNIVFNTIIHAVRWPYFSGKKYDRKKISDTIIQILMHGIKK